MKKKVYLRKEEIKTLMLILALADSTYWNDKNERIVSNISDKLQRSLGEKDERREKRNYIIGFTVYCGLILLSVYMIAWLVSG